MTDYQVTTVPAQRLVALTGSFRPDELGRYVGPMFDKVAGAIGRVPGALRTPVATYSMNGELLDTVVGYATDLDAPEGFRVVELPECEAVTCTYRGPMSGIGAAWQSLHAWMVAQGLGFGGPCRETYVVAEGPDSEWVIELAQPVAR